MADSLDSVRVAPPDRYTLIASRWQAPARMRRAPESPVESHRWKGSRTTTKDTVDPLDDSDMNPRRGASREPDPSAAAPQGHIFVSYARRDQVFVDRLVESLEHQGERVWIDRESIPDTFKWMEQIRAAIVDAKACLFVISRKALDSEVWNAELSEAIQHGKRLVPLVVDDVQPQRVPDPLRELQWAVVDTAGDLEDDVHALIETIGKDPAWVEEHTRLAGRAEEWRRSDRKRSHLLRGTQLAKLERRLSSAGDRARDPAVTADQLAYIETSVRARKQRKAAGGTAAILMVLISILAIQQFLRAQRRQDIADAQTLAAAADEARGETGDDLLASTLLAIESLSIADTEEGRRVLTRNLALLPEPSSLLADFEEPVRSLAVSPDGRMLLVGTETQGVKLCDLVTLECSTTLEVPGFVRGVRFRADGQRLFTAGASAMIWNPLAPETPLFASRSPAATFAVSPDFEHIAVGAGSGNVSLLRVGGADGVLLSPFDSDDSALAFSPDGKYLATGDAHGGIRVWHVPSGEPLVCYGEEEPLRWSHGNRITTLAFVPGKRFSYVVAAGSGSPSATTPDNAIRLWYLCEPRPEREFLHEDVVRSIAFSDVGKFVASASYQEVKVFEYEENLAGFATARLTGEIRTPDAHNHAIAFIPESEILATAWSTADGHSVILREPSGAELARFALDAPVLALAFKGHDMLVTGEENGHVRIWPVPMLRPPEEVDRLADAPLETLIETACARIRRDDRAMCSTLER